jgi:hypothetical protein
MHAKTTGKILPLGVFGMMLSREMLNFMYLGEAVGTPRTVQVIVVKAYF